MAGGAAGDAARGTGFTGKAPPYAVNRDALPLPYTKSEYSPNMVYGPSIVEYPGRMLCRTDSNREAPRLVYNSDHQQKAACEHIGQSLCQQNFIGSPSNPCKDLPPQIGTNR